VWSKGFAVLIDAYQLNTSKIFGNTWDGFSTLVAETRSVSRFDIGGAQLALHPDYAIGQPGGCEGCVMGWTKFTAYADPADVRRLTQLDLSRLTRWHSCLNQSDMIAAASSQYSVEHNRGREDRTQATSSSPITEMLGRDSSRIATGNILDYREIVDSDGSRYGRATVRVGKSIQGATDWGMGEIREVRVKLGSKQEYANLRRRAEIVFFGRWDRSDDMRPDPGYGCPFILANESNLNLIRAGAARDYAATDDAE